MRGLALHNIGCCCFFLVTLLCITTIDGIEESSDALPLWEELHSEWGPVQVRHFGDASGPLVVAVHGMKDADGIRNEWNEVAQRLASEGFHVMVPNFHSAPKELQPGIMTGKAFSDLISNTLLHHNEHVPMRYRTTVSPTLVTLGKSWGARMAAQAAAHLGKRTIIAAGLVVPGLGGDAAMVLPKIEGDLAVFLVKDDPIVDFEATQQTIKDALGEKQPEWHIANTGGHSVVPEFTEGLVEFVKAAFERYASHSHELEI